jgi:hypothetical protein
MEASIKMAEQLTPNRRSDRGRMHGLSDEGFDAGQARFLKLTAITHQRFSSPLWSGDEVRKLHAIAGIELVVAPWPWCTCVRNARRWLLCENVGVGAPGH